MKHSTRNAKAESSTRLPETRPFGEHLERPATQKRDSVCDQERAHGNASQQYKWRLTDAYGDFPKPLIFFKAGEDAPLDPGGG